MLRYFAKQIAFLIPVMFGVTILVFLMMNVTPGGAVESMVLRGGAQVSGEDLARFREEMGLNDPLYVQYLRFLSNALRGDLGQSLRFNRPVSELLLEQLPATVKLAVAGMGLAVILGMVLGLVAALHQNSWIDSLSMVLALVGWSMPSFWLGLLLILVFALRLSWFSITTESGLAALAMPAMTLAMGTSGLVARLVRSSTLEVLRMDYVITARAKGLSERLIVLRHVLRNALIPVVTMTGLQFGRLLSGTVIIETVFARQGIGRITVNAILDRDMPLVQGAVLLFAVIYVLANLGVDLSYAILDPRIRDGQKS
jgi:peptide/nickel transport system permease protein